jgi:hypothetical protein
MMGYAALACPKNIPLIFTFSLREKELFLSPLPEDVQWTSELYGED